MSHQEVLKEIRGLVADHLPFDPVEEAHRAQVLEWLDSTDDVFRRAKPGTPPQHLVAYFLLADPKGPHFLLCDHIKAGRWLPSGGHVEPGENPVDTVRREASEELGVQATFLEQAGEKPVFLTVTGTVGTAEDRHTDVSLWFLLVGQRGETLHPDTGEFRSVRWWTRSEVLDSDPALFDPHMARMLAKVETLGRAAPFWPSYPPGTQP